MTVIVVWTCIIDVLLYCIAFELLSSWICVVGYRMVCYTGDCDWYWFDIGIDVGRETLKNVRVSKLNANRYERHACVCVLDT